MIDKSRYLELAVIPSYRKDRESFVFPYAFDKLNKKLISRSLYVSELLDMQNLSEIEIVLEELEVNGDKNYQSFPELNVSNVMDDNEILECSLIMYSIVFNEELAEVIQ